MPTYPSDRLAARVRLRLRERPGLTALPVCPWCGREVAPAEYDRHLGTCKGEA